MAAEPTHRLLRALKHLPVDQTPVWFMRQAGRYMPVYQATRKRAGSFVNLCKTPELMCEVTLQPLKAFELDAAIMFSDILVIPDAMGLGLSMPAGIGPTFEKAIRTDQDVRNLANDVTDELGYVFDGIKLIKQSLNGSHPLLGFCGSPWTLATYMVEGGVSKDFVNIKRMQYSDPDTLSKLLDTLVQAISHYLIAQIKAGVDALMIFDTWGSLLAPEGYKQFSINPIKRILDALAPYDTPIILYSKGMHAQLDTITTLPIQALSVDWTANLGRIRQQLAGKIALQGNLDPFALFGSNTQIDKAIEGVLADYGTGTGHIFNLGHGIHRLTPQENVAYAAKRIAELSRQYHQNTVEA